MTDSEIIEILAQCHLICENLMLRTGYKLSTQERLSLKGFMPLWEDDLSFKRPELLDAAGIDIIEFGNLGAYFMTRVEQASFVNS